MFKSFQVVLFLESVKRLLLILEILAYACNVTLKLSFILSGPFILVKFF